MKQKKRLREAQFDQNRGDNCSLSGLDGLTMTAMSLCQEGRQWVPKTSSAPYPVLRQSVRTRVLHYNGAICFSLLLLYELTSGTNSMIFMKCLSTLAPEAQSLISVPLCAGLFLVSRLFIENNHSFFCHFPLLKPYKIQGVIITCKFHCGCVFYMNTFNYHRQNTFMQQMNTIQVQISDDRRLPLWIPLQQGCGPIDTDFQCCQLYQSERRVDDVLYVSYKCVFLNW